MTAGRNPSFGWLRPVVRLAVAIVGVASIIASGGGGGGSSCAFIIPGPSCDFGTGGGGGITLPPPSATPTVTITPLHQVAQVGTSVSITAQVTNLSDPTFTWCRLPRGGDTCVVLPGEYGATLTNPSVGMSDDGAQFRVTASGSQGTPSSPYGALYVSPMPPVVFEDGEFLESDWVVTSAVGSEGAPTFSFSRAPAGGNPGAFLSETYNIPPTVGQTLIFHSRPSANYYPTSQGSIYFVEVSVQCKTSTPLTWVTFTPMLEQGDRRFSVENPNSFGSGRYCDGTAWHDLQWGPIMAIHGVSGPACTEACPDFSASAPPIRFGLMVIARSLSPGAPQPITYGYDNWKVKVWRR